MEQIPNPCITCRIMLKHGCQMQPICSRVKAYYKKAIQRELDGQAVERGYRIRKKISRKYKGGAM